MRHTEKSTGKEIYAFLAQSWLVTDHSKVCYIRIGQHACASSIGAYSIIFTIIVEPRPPPAKFPLRQ